MDTKRVRFSGEEGELLIDKSLSSEENNEASSFEYLSFNGNYLLKPVKDVSKFKGRYLILTIK